MSENTQEPIYYVNPYGEKVNFSLQGKYSVFKNTIETPGAKSFNKEEFCKEILNIFAANRVVSLRLVVAEGDEDKLNPLINTLTIKSKSDIKELAGFGLDEQKSIAPFHFRGIKSNVSLEQLHPFLLKHSLFSIDRPINSLQFTSPNGPDKKKGLGGDKYFSEFVILSKASNRQYFVSSFYTSAKHIDLLSLIRDFELFSVGKIITVSRKLSLGNLGFPINKDLDKIIPYGVSGIGQTRINPPYSAGKYSYPFSLEWIEQEKVGNGIQSFIKKHMRIRSFLTTVPVEHVRISKNYPIETKENARQLSKREFADKMRFNPTEAEEAMGYLLGTLKLNFHERFKRQITIAGFIADFYSAQFRLAIEVDGKSHLTEKGKLGDKKKEMAFFRHSIMTIRVTNEDALYYPDTVKSIVQKAMKKWHSTSIGTNPWDLSDEEIFIRITNFRESLSNDIG